MLIGINTFSQEQITVTDSAADGTIKYAIVHSQPKAISEPSKAFLNRVLKAEKGTEFYLYKIVTDELGMTHEKYQQTFNGIKVEFCEFIIHKDKSGNIISINGEFAKIPAKFNTNRKLEFKDALAKSVKKYNILDLPDEKSVETPNTKRDRKHEVVIIKGNDNQYHLAYKANLEGENIFDSFYGYIACETGELIFRQNLIYQTNSLGTSATTYSGNQTITTDSYSGGFRLREISRGGTSTAIQTFNFNRLPAFTFTEVDNGIANATDFSDNNNIWSAAEHANANQDNAALDAHWGAERTFDYFRTVHNRNSYDGNNGLIKSYVHVRTRNSSTGPITDMDNAFWLDSRKAMFYGDGLFFDPTVSLDVCAHEMAHAVCNSTIGNGTGLIYSKESGALNESLSDIWGACVEQWATTGKQTWLCGEDIIPGGGRSMNNPNTHNQPDTYQATNNFWMDVDNCIPSNANDKCGVHTNSGVGNFWFFLLSQGGTGTNDHGNTYDIRGIGITNAARIVYRMEDVYLNPTDGYNNARTASIFAATDLFGANSCEVISTTNAWYAVGVGSSFQYSNVSISGASSVCASGTNFTINNIPTGCTINWTYSSNLQSYGSGSNYISLKAIGGGSGWVRAILNSGCGQVTLPQKNVHVGITASFSGNSSVLYLGTGTWTATASCGSAPYNYDWFLRKDGTGSGAISIATTNKLTLQSVIAGSAYVLSEKADDPIINQPITNTVFYLYARAYDANGNVYITPEQRILAYGDVDLVPANMPYTQKSASITETQESGQTDTYLEIYPNPASDNLTVNILSSTVDQEDKIVISVFDVNMTKSKQIYTDSKQNNINISDLNKGIYFIQVQFCGEQWIEKIIVE